MGKKNLIDTNAAIDYFGNRLPQKGIDFIDNIDAPFISVITEMELLGWYRIPLKELLQLQSFVNDTPVLQLDHPVIRQTIDVFFWEYNIKKTLSLRSWKM